jgi:hypothetical protein
MMYVSESHCARLHGGSVRDCICLLPNKAGFLECPPVALAIDVVQPTVSRPPPRNLTGDICDHCGSPNMVRAGTCMLCHDCGSTSGGCS